MRQLRVDVTLEYILSNLKSHFTSHFRIISPSRFNFLTILYYDIIEVITLDRVS